MIGLKSLSSFFPLYLFIYLFCHLSLFVISYFFWMSSVFTSLHVIFCIGVFSYNCLIFSVAAQRIIILNHSLSWFTIIMPHVSCKNFIVIYFHLPSSQDFLKEFQREKVIFYIYSHFQCSSFFPINSDFHLTWFHYRCFIHVLSSVSAGDKNTKVHFFQHYFKRIFTLLDIEF